MNLDALDGIRRKMNLSTMSKPALIGVAAVLVVVAVVIAGRLLGAATTNDFQITKGEQAQGSAHALEVSLSASGSSSSAASATIFIHVAGAVTNPGLCELESGARMADAIQAAGGFTDDAIPESVNLARTLTDGEQVFVSSQQEGDQPSSEPRLTSPGNSQGSAVSAGLGLVNINKADVVELTSLPGVGEATAQKIVADRDANGTFKAIEDLKRVSGIGDKKYESLKDLICV